MSTLTPKLQAVQDTITLLYTRPKKGVGCCLHIVTDNDNIEDSHVDFCIKRATAQGTGHEDCLKLAQTIRALTLNERAILFGLNGWCEACEEFDSGEECYACHGKLVPIQSD